MGLFNDATESNKILHLVKMVLPFKIMDSMLCFVDTQKNCLIEHAEIIKKTCNLVYLSKKNPRIMRFMSKTILACLVKVDANKFTRCC